MHSYFKALMASSLVLSFCLTGCVSQSPKLNLQPLTFDGINEWQQHANKRPLDMAALQQSLIKAGGEVQQQDKVLPGLPKTLVLYTGSIGTFSGRYSTKLASDWKSALEKWCTREGGVMSETQWSVSEGYRVAKSEQNPSSQKASDVVLATNGMLVCVDRVGIERYRTSVALAELTLFMLTPRTSYANPPPTEYLVVMGRDEIKSAKDLTAEIVRLNREEEMAKYRKAEAEWSSAMERWEENSRRVRTGLRIGDTVFITGVDLLKRQILVKALVVNLRTPLAQIQYNGKLEWVQIGQLYSLEIPPLLLCDRNTARGRCYVMN